MSKLSKKELAALDLLIAHMEEAGNEPVDLAFISGFVNAVSHVARAVAQPAVSAVTNAANATANAALAASRAVAQPAIALATNAANATANAALAASRAVAQPAIALATNVANATANAALAALAANQAAMHNILNVAHAGRAPAFAANRGIFAIGRGIFGADQDWGNEGLSEADAEATLRELIEIRNKNV